MNQIVKSDLVPTGLHPLVEASISSNNYTPESLDKLLQVQKEWEANEAKKLFNAAFTEMQKDLPVIPKTAKGHNCVFAPLDVSIDRVRPCLDEHGFSFRHAVTQEGAQVTVECILAHAAGHSESSTMTAAPDTSGSKNQIQAIGSTRTYLKRYTFEDVIGIATGDGYDDDGVGAGDPVDPKDAMKEMNRSRFLSHVMVTQPALKVICKALDDNDYSTAKEAKNELNEEELTSIWIAPSKLPDDIKELYSYFTTEHQAKIKSPEWSAA